MTNVPYTIAELIDYVIKSEETDETGDATFSEWLRDIPLEKLADDQAFDGWKFSSMLEAFLIAMCGPYWKEFLDTAEVGDLPPEQQNKYPNTRINR